MQLSAEARNFLKGLLQKSTAERPTIDKVLAHPWLQDLGTGNGTSVAAPKMRYVVEVAPQPPPSGLDAAAQIAGASAADVHAFCAAIEAPKRTAAEKPRPATPPLREDSAMQVRPAHAARLYSPLWLRGVRLPDLVHRVRASVAQPLLVHRDSQSS